MSLVHRKGALITCDIPTMQVIKFMDKQEGGKMIIKELDERNVFIHRTFSACSHSLSSAPQPAPAFRFPQLHRRAPPTRRCNTG